MNFLKNSSTKIITFIFILIFGINNSVNAQLFTKKVKGNGEINTETRTVSDYKKIGINGNFEVKLLKDQLGKITIKADENLMEYIIIEVKNENLNIKTKKGYVIKPSKKIEITIPFEHLESLALAGSGTIFTTDLIKTKSIKLNIAGSGNMNLNISAKNTSSNIAGSGNLKIQGETNEFNCSIAGSGNLIGYNLKTTMVNAKIAGSGNIKINAQNEINAQIAGSGNVLYTGNPNKVKSKSVGSGSLKKKG